MSREMITVVKSTNPASLVYFVQRGRFTGYWKRVPLSDGRIHDLHARLRDRGHFVKELPNGS